MSRILVTGAYGLLGESLIPVLSGAGHEVVRAGRRHSADIVGDLCDVDQAASAVQQAAPNVVINLAALTNVDQCEREPQQAYLTNVRIVENLAAAIAGMGSTCHLLQISTDHVYDGAGRHVEDDVTLVNYYAFSKYSGELVAARVPSTILRTNFFGPSRTLERASFSDWLARSLSRGEQVEVFEDVFFSPLSLRRLCSIIEQVVRRRPPGTFNLGSHGGLSKADFAFALARVLGLPTGTLRRSACAGKQLLARRPTNMIMDCSRFEAALGMRLPSLEDEINSMKDEYRHEG